MTSGFVSIVGAGPGAADLITVRGLDRIEHADVIVYDRLVSKELLRNMKAELIYCGKAPGNHTMTQDDIEALLIAKARAGKRVVRLKGGDPFVFGRGGEEALALVAAGIDYEIVPGISSAIAAPAAAGIPVTHRGLSSSVTIATGHAQDEGAAGETLVFLMSVARLPQIADGLIGAGRSGDTPAAIVQDATLPTQRVVRAPLARIADVAAEEGIRSPAVLIVGEVAVLGAESSETLAV